jgi:hypothetical protein
MRKKFMCVINPLSFSFPLDALIYVLFALLIANIFTHSKRDTESESEKIEVCAKTRMKGEKKIHI